MESYYIRAEYFYYTGTCYAPKDGALRDQAGNRLEFASRAEAASHLCEERTEFNSDYAMGCERNPSGKYSFGGTYILQHGEYSRPVFSIRKVPATALLSEIAEIYDARRLTEEDIDHMAELDTESRTYNRTDRVNYHE